MKSFKEQFNNLNSEYLLELRARGDGIAEAAHSAIEEIFKERNEYLPARPSEPIEVKSRNFDNNRGSRFLHSAFAFIAMLMIWGGAKQLGHSWIGFVIGVPIIMYMFAQWVRRNNLPPEQREIEDNQKIVKAEALTELMVCAESGKLGRVRELVEYGADVNAKSLSGTTALMYAARNNHVDVLRYLLESGADWTVESNKNSTAIDIARRFGNAKAIEILEKIESSN